MNLLFWFKLMTLFLWLLTKYIYDFLRFILWIITRFNNRLVQNQPLQPLNHEIGHVETILFRYSMDLIGQPAGIDNFITYHSGFVDTSYILESNVTLYAVNEKQVVFVETDGIDIHSMDNGAAFIRFSQFKHAKKIITFPLWAFVAFGKHKIGHPKKDVVFVGNTARCGSSLLMQVFDETTKCVIISESDTIAVEQELHGKLDDKMIDDVLEAVINTLCKPTTDEKELYVIKFGQPQIGNLPRIIKLFPEAKHLFLYRKGLSVVQSYAKAWSHMPFGDILAYGYHLSAETCLKICLGFDINEKIFPRKSLSYHEMAALVWASNVRHYLFQRNQGFEIPALRYEDMVSDTEYAIKQVFKYLALEYHNKIVDSAFSKDSQRNTPLDRSLLAKRKPVASLILHPSEENILVKLCESFEVPDFRDDIVLPGTITYRKK